MFKKINKSHHVFQLNEKGKDYWVGDIQGHYSCLMKKLDEVGFDAAAGDRLFSAGDIVNGGENSPACINLLLKPWFKAAFGNHEEILLQLLEDDSVLDDLLKVGGDWVLDYEHEPSKLKFLLAIIYSQMYVSFTVETSVGRIGVIHAQAPCDWNSAISGDVELKDALWSLDNYKRPGGEHIKNIDVVVSGHVNCIAPVCKGNQLWIDTIKLTGDLTILTAEQIIEVVNNGVY